MARCPTHETEIIVVANIVHTVASIFSNVQTAKGQNKDFSLQIQESEIYISDLMFLFKTLLNLISDISVSSLLMMSTEGLKRC